MKLHNLLFNRMIGSTGVPRKFVRSRKIKAERPLEHLCMDIKYIYIHGAQRNALLLTVIEAFSRKVLTHMLRLNIKKGRCDYFVSSFADDVQDRRNHS
jgi:putative transposase